MNDRTIKIVINRCYGGFSLSPDAIKLYEKLSGSKINGKGRRLDRKDHYLVKVVEMLGDKASGQFSSLEIYEIPAEFAECYEIKEYDGIEDVDTSPQLLISHKLNTIDVVEGLTDAQCKEILTELWYLNHSDY